MPANISVRSSAIALILAVLFPKKLMLVRTASIAAITSSTMKPGTTLKMSLATVSPYNALTSSHATSTVSLFLMNASLIAFASSISSLTRTEPSRLIVARVPANISVRSSATA